MSASARSVSAATQFSATMVFQSSPTRSGLLAEPHADKVIAEAERGSGLLLPSAADELNGLIFPLLLEERKGLDGIRLRYFCAVWAHNDVTYVRAAPATKSEAARTPTTQPPNPLTTIPLLYNKR